MRKIYDPCKLYGGDICDKCWLDCCRGAVRLRYCRGVFSLGREVGTAFFNYYYFCVSVF